MDKKTVRLTKKRLDALNTAISMDDILYAKFERMYRQFHRDVDRMYRRPKEIVKIIKIHKDYFENVQMKKVEITPEGTIVYI